MPKQKDETDCLGTKIFLRGELVAMLHNDLGTRFSREQFEKAIERFFAGNGEAIDRGEA